MRRPFKDRRPVGPFVSTGRGDISEFQRVEIERTPDENTNYTVNGLIREGVAGLVVDTNALVINSNDATADSYTIAPYEHPNSNVALEITPPPDKTVGIKEQSRNLVNIVIEP